MSYGPQDFWLAGARVYIQREGDANGTLIDLGVIQSASPAIETEAAELYDADGGQRVLAARENVQTTETWEVVCSNFAMDNLALFYQSEDPTPYEAPAPEDLDEVPHKAVIGPGRFVKLVDANGNWLYNIDSITVMAGTSELVEGQDWEWPKNGKDRGFIRIIPGGAVSNGDDLDITIQLNALDGDRVIIPQSAAGSVYAKAVVVYGRGKNARQTVREARVSIDPSTMNISSEEFSDLTFSATVLSDITQIGAGRMIQIKGALPTNE